MAGERTIGELTRSITRRKRNRETFTDDAVVRHFAGDGDRRAAERAVRERLTDWLDGKAMLDVGVGGGRMTAAYGHLVATYVGLDYAEPMVDACRARFAGVPNLTFVLGDVRTMPQFDPGSFDFVLCACNWSRLHQPFGPRCGPP